MTPPPPPPDTPSSHKNLSSLSLYSSALKTFKMPHTALIGSFSFEIHWWLFLKTLFFRGGGRGGCIVYGCCFVHSTTASCECFNLFACCRLSLFNEFCGYGLLDWTSQTAISKGRAREQTKISNVSRCRTHTYPGRRCCPWWLTGRHPLLN